MDKEKLVIGKTYLHHRKVDIGDRELEGERWVKCVETTKTGALFQHEFEVFELTNEKIQEEIIRAFP